MFKNYNIKFKAESFYLDIAYLIALYLPVLFLYNLTEVNKYYDIIIYIYNIFIYIYIYSNNNVLYNYKVNFFIGIISISYLFYVFYSFMYYSMAFIAISLIIRLLYRKCNVVKIGDLLFDILLYNISYILINSFIYYININEKNNITLFIEILVIYNIIYFIYIKIFDNNNFTNKLNLSIFFFSIFFLTVIILYLFIYRTNSFIKQKDVFVIHWSCFLDPANKLRSGFALFNEFPSQYGLLSIYAIAILKFESCFNSFLNLQVYSNLIAGLIIFLNLNKISKKIIWNILSIILIICTLTILNGWVQTMSGPLLYPSAGAYRFIWIYIIYYFIQNVLVTNNRDFIKWKVVLGFIIWQISLFWSFENVYLCTFIWIPVVTFYYTYSKENFKFIDLVVSFLKVIVFSIFFILIDYCIINIIYMYIYKQYFNISSYYEYTLSFSHGFGNLMIDWKGPITILVIINFIILFYIKYLNNITGFNLTRLICCATTFISISSYIILRGHPNNIYDLTPFYLLILADLIFINKYYINFNKLNIINLYLVSAIFTAFIIVPINCISKNNLDDVILHRNSLRYNQYNQYDNNLVELINYALKIRNINYSIIGPKYNESLYMNLETNVKDFIPIQSFDLFTPLKDSKKYYYLNKITWQKNGWIIVSRYSDNKLDWFWSYINKRYKFTNVMTNGGWMLFYAESR